MSSSPSNSNLNSRFRGKNVSSIPPVGFNTPAPAASAAPAAAPAVAAAPTAELLTVDDINSLYFEKNMYNPDNTVLPKLERAIPLLHRSHSINCSEYPTVYITSDIHADLQKFIKITRDIGLASMEEPIIEPYDIISPSVAWTTTSDPIISIYDPTLISNVTWTGGSGVIVVIVGDLVDGRRPWRTRGSINSPPEEGVHYVDDPYGSYEILLLSYLYNLRLKAREQGSEVLYTIGNHDFCTIISDLDWLNQNIHESAINFYNDNNYDDDIKRGIELRRYALRPFYKLNPFYMLSFMNGDKKEMACVHGGFHSLTSDGKIATHTEPLEEFQTKIDDGAVEFNTLPEPAYTAGGDDPLKGGPLWTRFYLNKSEKGVCTELDEDTNPVYPFIVVGHCTTDSSPRSNKLITTDPDRYAGCAHRGVPGNGCVVTDCDVKGHGPRLAFVDTAMSQAFRSEPNELRGVRVLRLTHTEPSSGRYYNRIESVLAAQPSETRIHYDENPGAPALGAAAAPAAAAAAVGGAGVAPPRRRGGRRSTRKRRMRRNQTKRRI